MSPLGKFFKHSLGNQWFLIEALGWLCWAKLLLLLIPFRWIAPRLGKQMAESPSTISSAERQLALRVSWAIQSVASALPLGLVCLPQAIAAKWMLRRRGLFSTLYLGLQQGESPKLTAHAWLRVGDKILTGEAQSFDHQIIATFAPEPGKKQKAIRGFEKQIRRLKQSRFLIGRMTFQFLKGGWILVRLLTNGEYRSEHVTRWKFRGHHFQVAFHTEHNRYPLLFAQCKTYLSRIKNPAILSFGCSIGEEVFTLGEYLPEASIMGVDINEWCLKQCKKKSNDPRFSFHHRLSTGFAVADNFDAIFCMAIFQRSENRSNTDNSIAHGFTFTQFEQEILMLDRKLKPGGIFIIDHADFSFTDTACSRNYKAPHFEENKVLRHRPLYDKDNHKVAETQNNYRMFIKIQPAK